MRGSMLARLAVLLLLAAALTIGACGGDDDDGGGGGGSGGTSASECPSGAVVIHMKDIKFDPQEASAGVGQEICWINDDTVDHDATAQSGADFKSELFGKGETFTATVDKPGTVKYECTVHPGMTGTIQVSR
jgi:plastocyanin